MVSLVAIEDALLQMAKDRGWPMAEEGPTLAVCAKETPGQKPKIHTFAIFDASVDELNQAVKDAGFSNLVRITDHTKLEEIPIMGTGKIAYRQLESEYMS